MEFHYTVEKNVQIVIALLKEYNIHRVIASPGTTNMTFIGSIQNDPYFHIWSSVDERSAAYMACGMASETGEPVVISCTGATASRNYMPGLTEAYYRKLPVIALTSHRGNYKLGHLFDQQVDRRNVPNDICVKSVTIPVIKDDSDLQHCIIETNKALMALTSNGGGPVHINMFTEYKLDFSVKDLPPIKRIKKYTFTDKLPEIQTKGRIAVFIGAHQPFTREQESAISHFCESYNAVVFTSPVSGYNGNYKINYSLICGQKNYNSELMKVDLLIHIGEISGNTWHVIPKKVWRVSEDGEVRDTFGLLECIFQMPEEYFFEKYRKDKVIPNDYYKECCEEYHAVLEKMPELPFGNIWMAQHLSKFLPEGSCLHLGILNSLRSWNLFELPKNVTSRCNVGGYGIDGGVSSLIGASLAEPKKLFFGVFGDLAFFYDMNVLGNRHVGNNIRLLLINNGRGTEFRNYGHFCSQFGEDADKFMAAAGHFGNKSELLVKHYATDLGFRYLSASNKDEFKEKCTEFLNTEKLERPILFEVFTNQKDESDALEMVQNYMIDKNFVTKRNIKKIVSSVIGDKSISTIKKIIK